MSKSKFLWMAVEPDEYELPIFIADTPMELARLLGTSNTNVMNSARLKECTGRHTGRKIVKVKKDERNGC